MCWIGVRSLLFEVPADWGRGLSPQRPFVERIAQALGPVPARRAAPVAPDGPAPLLARIVVPPIATATLRTPASPRAQVGDIVAPRAGVSAPPRATFPLQAAVPRPARIEQSSAIAAPEIRTANRWSGEVWLFAREDARGLNAGASTLPSYGGSQAGAQLRYALVASRYRPTAYLRAVRALAVPDESDLAGGISIRPVPGLPIAAHGELRLQRRGAATTVAPAAFLSAGVDDVPLAAGMTARGFVQGGYIAGREGTAFADGSAIVERTLVRGGDSTLAGGLGLWGGAQRGASRLDFGPSASTRITLGARTIRVSADYRRRIAGDATPADGAAVTVIAGF